MNPDEKHESYMEGFRAGEEHKTSSPLTLEKFKNIDDKIDNLEDKFMTAFHTLKGMVEEGFKITHEKQDKTNGNVKENTEHRIKQITHNKWMYGVLTILIIPILFLIFT